MDWALSSGRAWLLLGLVLLSCDRAALPAPRADGGAAAARASVVPGSPFDAVASSALSEALSHAKVLDSRLAGGCTQDDAYLGLRRAVARGKSWWRQAASEPAEVLLGPVRPVTEGGGHLGLLDGATAEHDCSAARASLYQIEHALRLIALHLRRPIPPRYAARAWCDIAVDLGQILLESHPEVATSEAGVLADATGSLDAIEQGLTALVASKPSDPSADVVRARSLVVNLRAALQRAQRDGLRQRGKLVVETGELGALLRSVAKHHGLSVNPPYAPRVRRTAELAAESVNALTVPAARTSVDERAARLGKRLFSDRRLSRKRTRSCASCHRPNHAFTDGRARAEALTPAGLLRNTPTLLYAATQAAQLWDGRVLTSQSQALRVIHSDAELALPHRELEQRLAEDRQLSLLFSEIFPDGVSAKNVARALSEYQSASLVPVSAPIDAFAGGDPLALGALEQRGLDVFAGKGRCARCHVPPLFSGTRPYDFAVTIYAVIGTTTDARGKTLDTDRGRFLVTDDPRDDRAFKTPGLRNVARTAPYFHHGGFGTLESVIDFYDRGGGRGFGHAVENQDPDVRKLSLSADERRALLAFLEISLTDAPSSK